MQILFDVAKTFFIPKQRPRKLIQFVGVMIRLQTIVECDTNLNKLHVAKENEPVSSLFSLRGYFRDYRGLISSSQLLQSSGVPIIYPTATLPLWVILQPPTPNTQPLQSWLGSEEVTPGSKAGPRKSLESKQQMPECPGLCLKIQENALYHTKGSISQCQGPLGLPGSGYI